MQYFDAGRARGAAHRRRPPPHRDRREAPHLHLQPLPGTDLALANGLLHIAIREGLVDEDYVAERTTGFDAVRAAVAPYWPDRVERITGVPVADLRETVRLLAATRRGDDPDRPRRRAAPQGHRHRAGLDQPRARARAARPAGLAAGARITGQGNGQGGREHGQKADQLPGYRKLDDPAARAHVAGGLGRRPRRPARARARRPTRCSTRSAPTAACARCWSWPPTSRSPRRTPRTCSDGSTPRLPRRLRLLPLRDRRARRRRPAQRQWAEEDGHDDQPRGPGHAAAARRCRRRPGVRTDLQLLAELADRLGRGRFFSDDPEMVFDELRRASAGGAADYAGISYERIDAEQRRVLALPGRGPPGHAAAVPERFATAGRPRPLPPRRPPRRRRGAGRATTRSC